MGKFGKILSGASVGIVALAVAGIAILKTIDINQHKVAIADRVKAATGRDLVLGGDMELDISLQPVLVLKDVGFANPPGMSRPVMATLQRLEARVELLALLKGIIRVNYIVLEGLDIQLERNAAGLENWVLERSAPTGGGDSGVGSIPVVDEVRLRKILVIYVDGSGGERMALRLDSADLKAADANGPVVFAAKGAAKALPFELTGDLGPMSALLAGGPLSIRATLNMPELTLGMTGAIAELQAAKGLDLRIDARAAEMATAISVLQSFVPAIAGLPMPPRMGPLDASVKIAGSVNAMTATDIQLSAGATENLRVSLTGAVHDVLRFRQIDININVEGNDLSIFSDLAGMGLSSDKPFQLAGRLSDGDNVFGIDGMTFKAGKTSVSGWMTASLQQPQPMLEAQLLADQIDLGDLPLPPAKQQETPSQKRLFSTEPLAVAALKSVDADVSFRAKRINANGMMLGDVESQIVLKSGRLTARPIKASIARGQAQGTLVIDASVPTGANLETNVILTGVQAGVMARDLAGSDILEGGPLDVRIDLKGRGQSQQALVAALTGEVRAAMGPGRIRNSALDIAGADLGMSAIRAINPFSKEEPFTPIKCGAAKFVFANGKALADRGIALESERMIVTGSGQVVLASEEIDFAIRPEAREGLGINLGSAASMVRLTGTLSQPTVGLDALETTKKALSVGTALATGGISLLADGLIGRATQDASPCRTALGLAAASTPSSPPPPAAATSNQAPVHPQPKEEGGLGGLLRGLGKSIDDALGVMKP